MQKIIRSRLRVIVNKTQNVNDDLSSAVLNERGLYVIIIIIRNNYYYLCLRNYYIIIMVFIQCGKIEIKADEENILSRRSRT